MSIVIGGYSFSAYGEAQTHRGKETRRVRISSLPVWNLNPSEAQELALTILDAARVALACEAPLYPEHFSKEGNPLSSDWDPSRKRTARAKAKGGRR